MAKFFDYVAFSITVFANCLCTFLNFGTIAAFTDLLSRKLDLLISAKDGRHKTNLYFSMYISSFHSSCRSLSITTLIHRKEILILFQNLIKTSHILSMLCTSKCKPERIKTEARLLSILLLIAWHASCIIDSAFLFVTQSFICFIYCCKLLFGICRAIPIRMIFLSTF